MVSITITFLRHLNLVTLERVFDGVCVLRLPGIGDLLAEVTDGRNYAVVKERREMNNNVIKFMLNVRGRNMSLINGR